MNFRGISTSAVRSLRRNLKDDYVEFRVRPSGSVRQKALLVLILFSTRW
jgi:hypothetical protein